MLRNSISNLSQICFWKIRFNGPVWSTFLFVDYLDIVWLIGFMVKNKRCDCFLWRNCFLDCLRKRFKLLYLLKDGKELTHQIFIQLFYFLKLICLLCHLLFMHFNSLIQFCKRKRMILFCLLVVFFDCWVHFFSFSRCFFVERQLNNMPSWRRRCHLPRPFAELSPLACNLSDV